MISADIIFDKIVKRSDLKHDREYNAYTFTINSDDISYTFDQLGKELRSINKTIEVRKEAGNYSVELEDGIDNWEAEYKNYFFSDKGAFYRYAVRNRKIPDTFCIIDGKITSLDKDDDFIIKVKMVAGWADLLYHMADHVQDNNLLVFFVHHKEGRAKTHTVNPIIEFDKFNDINVGGEGEELAYLYESWSFDDFHRNERRSVMLASLAEIISKSESDNNLFEVLITQSKKLHDRYNENYEIYVNRFTVDEQLREIDERYLDFIGKLQNLVTASQNKAFAIPGVMVAAAAFAKSANSISVILILISVVMTRMIIVKSNDLVRDNLGYFKETVDRSFGKYIKSRNEDEEINNHAQALHEKLKIDLEKANSRLKFIDDLSFSIQYIGVLSGIAIVLYMNIG